MNVKILDTTLRDGSYRINFAFTSADTAALAKGLEDAGVGYVEIGHGVGLNAGNRGFGVAAATDQEYMEAAAASLDRAKWGMFCIPGIATVEDVHLAGKHEMDFIRIGTNVTEVEGSEPFIRAAKDYGMLVMANYMKSYALSPTRFAENVALSERFGADVIYIVDSAGSMFPDQVVEYMDAIRRGSGVRVGFHAHDNLGLGVANCLAMAQHGCEFIDGSLQGLGRSSGNAPTEVLVAALDRVGFSTGVDLVKVLKIGHKRVQSLLGTPGRMPLDVVAGFSGFHSSYMPQVLKVASKHKVDPALLMIELCNVDRVNAPLELLESIAKRLPQHQVDCLDDYGMSIYIGGEQDGRK